MEVFKNFAIQQSKNYQYILYVLCGCVTCHPTCLLVAAVLAEELQGPMHHLCLSSWKYNIKNEEDYKQNCICATVLCTIIMVPVVQAVLTNWSAGSRFGLFTKMQSSQLLKGMNVPVLLKNVLQNQFRTRDMYDVHHVIMNCFL